MTVQDINILGKKIVIGLVVGLIPLVLVVTGLWLITTLLK